MKTWDVGVLDGVPTGFGVGHKMNRVKLRLGRCLNFLLIYVGVMCGIAVKMRAQFVLACITSSCFALST